MRLVDLVIRQGHLSDRVIAEAVIAGERPVHLEHCDICADRAVETARWLDQVRDAATAAADQAFPPERLSAQQAQILRRLEQMDEPARVIAFPGQARLAQSAPGSRRVAPSWVGVAAAAGLFVGALGGHFTARADSRHPAVPATPASSEVVAPEAPATASEDVPGPVVATDASLIERDLDGFTPTAIQPLDDVTPTLLTRSTTR